jgi:hypothetical protein
MKFNITLFLGLFVIVKSFAQISTDNRDRDFKDNIQVPEENIYIHLNKSVFLPNEDIGFTAYVIDKKSRKASFYTTNLYCQLLDENDVVVKEKLLKVNLGTANDVFRIDSLVGSGNFKIKAFTNWMRNFERQEHAAAPLKVVDTSQVTRQERKADTGYDLQLLPEGGHAVNGVFIKVGVILKNATGLGKKLEGIVKKDGSQIATVKLDDNGIGSFLWLPTISGSYEVSFEADGKTYRKLLPPVKETGVTLAAKEVSDQLVVELSANLKTLESSDNLQFIVAINGHSKLKQFQVNVDKEKNLVPFPLDSLQPGMNQISLFSKEGRQLSERLFFNYKNLKVVHEGAANLKLDLDTLRVDLDYKKILDGSLSVSILPTTTIAQVKNRHIASKFELSPYLNGNIQNPSQYFKATTRRTKYNMDNLVLCQGWKMYEWSEMVSTKDDYKFSFENGINTQIKINNNKDREYYIHPSRNTSGELIEIEAGSKDFNITGYFPTTNERFIISKSDKKGVLKQTSVFPIFSPNQFPNFKYSDHTAFIESQEKIKDISLEPFRNNLKMLDTVVINAYSKEERNERISNRSRGRVDFFDDKMRTKYIDILQYLRENGFNATQRNGEINISSYTQRLSNSSPILVIDGNQLFDYSVLIGFDMTIVDYIDIDTSGLGGSGGSGGRQGSAIITIKTDPLLNPFKKESKTFSSYDVPLTFSFPTKFYRPQYYSYNSDFFNKLGVMDWLGNVKMENGKASLATPYLGISEVLLTIEGMTLDGTLIHEQKVVKISQ